MLAEVLRRNGYVTLGATTNVWAGRASGFDTGFSEFVELDTSRHNELGGGIRKRLRWDLDALRGHSDDGARQATSVISHWLGDVRSDPFFLFANLVECHSPYLPPRTYLGGASMLTRLRAAHDAQRYLTFDGITRACLGIDPIPEASLKRMRRLYAASLRYLDDWIAGLLRSLSERRLDDSTLVIVCSDHGENLGEGGFITHGLSLDDRLLRVPFIAAGPGAEAFEGIKSLQELPSRIAAAVGLREHPWDGGLINGLPVAQWDQFSLPAAELEAFAARLGVGVDALGRLTSPLTCAVSGRFKLVVGADPSDEALYDLEADPLEVAPLREEGAMVARSGHTLTALRSAVQDPRVQATGEVNLEPDALSAGETADIERKMRLLGYM